MFFDKQYGPVIILIISIISIALMFQTNCVNWKCTITDYKTKEGLITIIISIIWGLGIAFLFKKSCANGKCVIIENKNITK